MVWQFRGDGGPTADRDLVPAALLITLAEAVFIPVGLIDFIRIDNLITRRQPQANAAPLRNRRLNVETMPNGIDRAAVERRNQRRVEGLADTGIEGERQPVQGVAPLEGGGVRRIVEAVDEGAVVVVDLDRVEIAGGVLMGWAALNLAGVKFIDPRLALRLRR